MTIVAMSEGYLGPHFDGAWYATRYHGLVGDRAPLEHYLAIGRERGCKPNPSILLSVTPRDPRAFTLTDLNNEQDVIDEVGVFDRDWYAAVHEVAAASALRHYLIEGAYRGLDPSPFFSTETYYRDYPEVAAAGSNPLWHYILFGFAATRDAAPQPRYAALLDFDEDVWRCGFAGSVLDRP